MASKNETGHARNVAHLETLISFCTNYGATYNPSKAAIQLPALNALLTNARAAIDDVAQKVILFRNSTNARRLLFQELKPLSTKLINALSVTEASAKTLQDAKAINKKIQGTRSPKKEEEPNTSSPQGAGETKTISTSQQSYDQQVEHFNLLINLLQNEASYNPNETELQVATLSALLNNMRAANTNVINNYTAISNSRIIRNEILYQEETGLCILGQEAKRYIKSVFGTSSPQYKQVTKLEFSNTST